MCKEIEFEKSITAKCPRCLSRIRITFTDNGDLVEVVDEPVKGISSTVSEIRKKAEGLLTKKESCLKKEGEKTEQGE